MNKADFVSLVAEKLGSSKADAERAVNAFADTVSEILADGGSVTLMGFGAFKVSERKSREGRNPRTGETIHIPAAKVPVFRAGQALKEAANKG